jgi:hypothetical protein
MIVAAVLALELPADAGGFHGGGCGGGYHGGGCYGGGCYRGGWYGGGGYCGSGWYGGGWGVGFSGCGWGVSVGLGWPGGLRRARVRRSGLHHTGCLHHRGLLKTGLYDRCLHDKAGLCRRSRYDLCRPGLRRGSAPRRTGGGSCHLHPGPNRAGLDAAARPASRPDLQLDASAEHGCLLRQHPVGRRGCSGRRSGHERYYDCRGGHDGLGHEHSRRR